MRLLIALFWLCWFWSAGPAAAGEDGVADLVALDEAELAGCRGGLRVGGLTVEVGVEVRTLFEDANGAGGSSVEVVQQRIGDGAEVGRRIDIPGASITFTPGGGTVISNWQDQRAITHQVVLNVAIAGLQPAVTRAAASHLLSNAIVNGTRQFR